MLKTRKSKIRSPERTLNAVFGRLSSLRFRFMRISEKSAVSGDRSLKAFSELSLTQHAS